MVINFSRIAEHCCGYLAIHCRQWGNRPPVCPFGPGAIEPVQATATGGRSKRCGTCIALVPLSGLPVFSRVGSSSSSQSRHGWLVSSPG